MGHPAQRLSLGTTLSLPDQILADTHTHSLMHVPTPWSPAQQPAPTRWVWRTLGKSRSLAASGSAPNVCAVVPSSCGPTLSPALNLNRKGCVFASSCRKEPGRCGLRSEWLWGHCPSPSSQCRLRLTGWVTGHSTAGTAMASSCGVLEAGPHQQAESPGKHRWGSAWGPQG